MMHTLKQNFYPNVKLTNLGGRVGHWADRRRIGTNPVGKLFGGHGPWKKEEGPCVYIYRDGRDVAVSLWLAKEQMNPDRRGLSFSEHLRIPLDWLWSPGHRAKGKRPVQNVIEHWRRHLELWANHPEVAYVRYEQLVLEPIKTLSAVGAFFSFPVPEKPKVVKEFVGLWPSKRPPGAWKTCFSPEDLQFFFRYVPANFWGLWNEEGDLA